MMYFDFEKISYLPEIMVLAKSANEPETKYHLYNITIISKVTEQKCTNLSNYSVNSSYKLRKYNVWIVGLRSCKSTIIKFKV